MYVYVYIYTHMYMWEFFWGVDALFTCKSSIHKLAHVYTYMYTYAYTHVHVGVLPSLDALFTCK